MNGLLSHRFAAYLGGMNKRIWIATVLMLAGTLGILLFQGYGMYQIYQQAQYRFRQDAQAALAATEPQALAWQRRQLLGQYRQWLHDTAHVRITCRLLPQGVTQFQLTSYLNGRPTRPSDKTEISFDDFRERVPRITPAAREFFIRRFTEGTIRSELNNNYVFFHTQWLGQQLYTALKRSQTPPTILRQLLSNELTRRGLGDVPFRLSTVVKEKPDTQLAGMSDFPLRLTPLMVGLPSGAAQTAQVWLPAAPGVVLGQLRWVLLASALLLLIVLGCFGYAVSTMRRQKKLADLKDDFTHNMTHELKTPVATIQLAAESLQRFAFNPSTTTEYVGVIHEQATRLGTLIDQILRSVALEQETQPLAYQPLDWPVLVGQVTEQLRPHFSRAARQVAYTPVQEPALVLGDETHLTNALATLLDNALKYGGPHLTLRTETSATTVSLLLHDDGPGIPAAYQEQVFEKFFRVPTGNRHSVKGYGLGLHYARQVARRHGGSLHLASSASHGTTFTLTLPLAPR